MPIGSPNDALLWPAARELGAAIGAAASDADLDPAGPPWEVNDAASAIHAGMVVDWVHKPAAIIAEKQIGAGRLTVSTFRLLTESPVADPVAASQLGALVATRR